MSDYVFTGRYLDLPDNFKTSIPSWCYNRLGDFLSLPIDNAPYTTANSSKIISMDSASFTDNNLVFLDNASPSGTATSSTGRKFIRPDAIFIIPGKPHASPVLFRYAWQPSILGGGLSFKDEQPLATINLEYTPLFWTYQMNDQGRDSYYQGIVAIDPDTREVLSTRVHPCARMNLTMTGKYRDKNYNTVHRNYGQIFSLFYTLLGIQTVLSIPEGTADTYSNQISNMRYSIAPSGYPHVSVDTSTGGGFIPLSTPLYAESSDTSLTYRKGVHYETGSLPMTFFKKTVITPTTEDYNRIFTMSDEELASKIIDGGEYAPDTSADPYTPGGISSSAGGDGSFGRNPETGAPETSDPITVPNGSVAGDASATGMMTRYLANSSQLEIFGDWLWTDDLGLTIAKAAISLLYGSPAEAVISLMSYPFDISSLSGVTTRSQNIYWGNHNSGIGATALTSPAATIDWGTISLREYWGNFLDYEPHTKIELYLPWGTGFVPIDPGQCLPGTLRVVTNIDLNKGSCIHNVFGNNNCVIGTYAGQCSQQIPIISNDYASKIAGVVTAATSLAIAGTSGALASSVGAETASQYRQSHFFPMGDVKGMNDYLKDKAQTVAEAEAPFRSTQRKAGKLAAASSIAASRRTGGVSRNGSFTDGSAALGCQYPYIILSRPTQSIPKEYGSHYGYPSNRTAVLGELRGYTEVGEIHFDGIDATCPELSELDHILKGGVIF